MYPKSGSCLKDLCNDCSRLNLNNGTEMLVILKWNDLLDHSFICSLHMQWALRSGEDLLAALKDILSER